MIIVEKKKVDFSNMDSDGIKSFIEGKKNKLAEYRNMINEAKTNDDLSLVSAKVEFETDQLEQARNELQNRAEKVLNSNLDDCNFNPNLAIRCESYSMNNGLVQRESKTSIESLALRSNEKLADRLKLENRDKLDLGKFIRGMYTGNWNGAEAEKRAYTTSATGVLIPEILSAQIIDAARNVSLFTEAQVPVIPMETNNLTIARVKKDPVFNFKEEAKEVENNEDMELDSVELKAKTIYGTAYVSIEAILSSKNLSEIILTAFSQAMANGIDKCILYGQGSNPNDEFAPTGIMNDEHVNSVTATNRGYDDFIKAIGAVRRANGTPTIMGINADTEEFLNLLTDNNGVYLNPPKAVGNLTQIVSNQLKSDVSDGSDALVFDPNAIVIGVQNDIRLELITQSDECIKKGLVAFQIYSMVDGVCVRPTHISKITGIKQEEPEQEEET